MLFFDTTLQHQLLTSLALGNWGNTPSPPNDPNAPPPVGNQGEFTLSIDDQELAFSIQSARFLTENREANLVITGEPFKNGSLFRLTAMLPSGFSSQEPATVDQLKGASLPLRSPSADDELQSRIWFDSENKFLSLSEGVLQVLSVTGTGPWEMDASVRLTTTFGSHQGNLKVRISKV